MRKQAITSEGMKMELFDLHKSVKQIKSTRNFQTSVDDNSNEADEEERHPVFKKDVIIPLSNLEDYREF